MDEEAMKRACSLEKQYEQPHKRGRHPPPVKVKPGVASNHR